MNRPLLLLIASVWTSIVVIPTLSVHAESDEMRTISLIWPAKQRRDNKRPQIRLSVQPDAPVASELVTFRARLKGIRRSKVRLIWRFSDQVSQQGNVVQREFESPGAFTVRVIAKPRNKKGGRLARGVLSFTVHAQGDAPDPGDSPDPGDEPNPDIPSDVQCDGAVQILDDFTSGPLNQLGTATALSFAAGLGVEPTSVVASHPLPETSTVLQLNFEDPSSPGGDSSLSALAATCSNCPSIASNGRIGSRAVFSGAEGLVTGAQIPAYGFVDTDFTWAMWFRSSSSATQYLLGSYCGYGHLGSHLRIAGGRIEFMVDPSSGAATTVVSNATNLTDGQWHHIAATRIAATGALAIYIDGSLDAELSGAALGGPINCNRFSIGMAGLGFPANAGFQGDIDAVTVHARALAESEIQRLFTASRNTGSFVSREITFQSPVYSLSLLSDESVAGRSALEVSFDGTTWCPVNGQLLDPACPFPANALHYRVNISDQTVLRSVQIDVDCTERCVDYDNDGFTAIATTAPFCSSAQLDCNDENPFELPSAQGPGCNCSGGASISEICSDEIDNDCDGAVDQNDNDCYSGGTIYYVSNSIGADSNPGTDPRAPVKSLALAQSILSNHAGPGDKVLFKRGDIWPGSTLSIDIQASAVSPFTLGTYGFGERPHFEFSSALNAVYLSGAQYITIDGLHFSRTAKTVDAYGISFNSQSASDYVTVRNVHIDGLAYGMLIKGSHFLLEDSILNDNENSQSGGGHSQGFWVYGGSDYGVVRNNIFENNGKTNVIFDHNVYLGGGNFWLFEGNDFSGESGTSIVFHGVQQGHVIRGNTFHDNTNSPAIDISDYTTGQLLQDFVVERNRIFNNSGAFWIRGAVNLTVRNNLFYNNTAVFLIGSGFDHETSMTVQHNTFYNTGGSSFATGTYTYLGNLYSGSSNYGGGISVGSSDFTNPATGDFTPLATSAAIDAAPSSALNHDFNGTSRPRDGNGDLVAVADYGAIER